jgi:hypothetical protein
MAELPRDFGDRLVAREEVDAMRMEQLREQIAQTLERKLTRPMRIASVVGGIFLVLLSLAFIPLTLRRWDELPPLAYLAVLSGIIGMVLTGLIMIAVGRRGVYDVRYHSRQAIAVAFLVCLGYGMTLLHSGWASGDGQAVFGGAVMLVVGAGAFMMHALEQYHLATKRKLLELELRLAEIADRLDRALPPGR